jgi:hypothetical protein
MEAIPEPRLVRMTSVCCDVGVLVTLGAAPGGERRYVPLEGGTLAGPELAGTILSGGIDWQWARADGVLQASAHYVVRTADGALVEVTSDGLRHGPPQTMARLARGEAVRPDQYFFRTFMRFCTGAPAWAHLNRTLAVASGSRGARQVHLDVYRLA